MQPTMTTDKYGTVHYKLNGMYHREDGPAVINADGTQSWYRKGYWHRKGGPAIIYPNGSQEWRLNDMKYTFEEYCKKLKLSEEDIMFLKLKYNTCVAE